MNSAFRLVIAALVLAVSLPHARAENWPNWRGPSYTSASGEKDIPIAWSEHSGIAWKTPIPEWGTSTPIVWDGSIFLTSQQGDDLLLLKIDADAGKVVWTRKAGLGQTPREAKRGEQKFHGLHNLASPSPVTDGETVVAHFGNGLLAAYDFDGKKLWERNLEDDHGKYTIWWGHANSPVIHGDLVISVCMQDPLSDDPKLPPKAESYLVAHDLKTGKRRWHTPRPTFAGAEDGDSYTTPVFADIRGERQMLVWGGNQLDAYDPATGKQLWFLPKLMGGRTVTGPTVRGDLVYVTCGMKGPLYAVAIDGPPGERTRKTIAWRYQSGTPDSCTPVLWGGLLFTITDDGIARCFDASSGHLKWKKRLPGEYKATPLVADGRIYFLNTDGLCTVVSAAERFDKLTENKLDDETLASPIAADGRIYIRGRKSLYAIRK